MLSRIVRRFSYNKAELLSSWKAKEAEQLQLASSKLTDFQQKRINLLADAILDMSDVEQQVLWQRYRDANEAGFGLDPAMFSDFYPKLDGLDAQPENLDFFKTMAMSGGFPGGFVESIIEGKTVDLFPAGVALGGGSSSGGAAAEVVEAVEEGPKSYTLYLKDFQAPGKIKIIKEVKGMLNLGLKEAKEVVEGVQGAEPLKLTTFEDEDKANEMKAKLADLGAEIDIKVLS